MGAYAIPAPVTPRAFPGYTTPGYAATLASIVGDAGDTTDGTDDLIAQLNALEAAEEAEIAAEIAADQIPDPSTLDPIGSALAALAAEIAVAQAGEIAADAAFAALAAGISIGSLLDALDGILNDAISAAVGNLQDWASGQIGSLQSQLGVINTDLFAVQTQEQNLFSYIDNLPIGPAGAPYGPYPGF